MRLATALVALLVILAPTPASGSPAGAKDAGAGAAVTAPLLPGAPAATKKPTAKASPSTSPSPSPSAPTRRPVDEEGDLWVNLAVIGGVTLIGTVVVFLIAGGLLRRGSRRREG